MTRREERIDTPYKLVWMASYPKSGNTWFRIFLQNYIENNNKPIDINTLTIVNKSPRLYFDHLYGINSVDLDFLEIDQRRAGVIDQYNIQNKFFKTHDAYTYLPNGKPLLGEHPNQAAVYIIRNPLDVAVSFAYYFYGYCSQQTVNAAVTQLNQSDMALGSDNTRFLEVFCRKLLSWSQHVTSWQNTLFPTLFLRYEDMLLDPFATFSQAVNFLRFPYNEERIKQAIKFSDFTELMRQEKESGFVEKPSSAQRFFRKGQIGDYRSVFHKKQIQAIYSVHHEVMQKFGY